MGALAIVECFAVIEELAACLAGAGKDAPVNQFEFERAPAAFPGGMVIAVAFATHGGHQAGLGAGGPISTAGVWPAAIGVKEQTRGRLAMAQGHAQGL